MYDSLLELLQKEAKILLENKEEKKDFKAVLWVGNEVQVRIELNHRGETHLAYGPVKVRQETDFC